MSLNATRTPIAVRLRATETLDNDLWLEGLSFVCGRIVNNFVDDREVSLEMLQSIHGKDATYNRQSWYYEGGKQEYAALDLEPLLANKSKGARYMMRRVYHGHYQQFGLKEFAELKSDWAAVKELRHWLKSVSEEDRKEMDLSVNGLMAIGVRFAWQADRFVALYRECYTKGRPWGSCYQPHQDKILMIATTPNYNRLPLWVKKIVVNSPEFNVGDRIGDIWRLIPCAKAWKHAPNLPKNLAEKVGKMEVRARILAANAWSYAHKMKRYDDDGNFVSQYDENGKPRIWERSRAEITNLFWLELRRLLKISIADILHEKNNEELTLFYRLDSYQMNILVQEAIGLPHGLIQSEIGRKNTTTDKYLQFLSKYGSTSKEACSAIFGVSGKRTQTMLKTASYNAVQWAMSLFYGNADAIQKTLEMTEMVNYQEDAVDFLMALPAQTRLKLLGATTFKYRGEVHPISDDHVRDTGYLWKQFEVKPELGRVRCWFSVHELLAKEYVKTLPDEPLPVDRKWQKVDGLCAVDGSWELEFPKSVATLKYWGERLSNCVGGYGNAIKSGRSIIFVVKEHGILTHCVEVANGYINQFYRKRNSAADCAIKESVIAALEQAKLI